MIRTPLRYPGGKSRAIKYLLPMFPKAQIDYYKEPFVGGGSIFLHLKQLYPEWNFWINDLYYELYCFWKMLQSHPETLYNNLMQMKTNHQEENCDLPINVDEVNRTQKARDLFFKCKEKITNGSEIDTATSFFVLNKCSYSGLTESGTFSPQASISNFSFHNIKNLLNVAPLMKGVKITNLDYANLLNYDDNDFVFLDPPYDILKQKQNNALYGKNGDLHKIFDHQRFFENMNSCTCTWGITYNSSPHLIERYKDYNVYKWNTKYGMQWDRSRGINKAKEKEELFITNYLD